uniref:Protein PTHB1 n=1 Tax=Trichuris muris TaxID=70415 RepID=A0A5S6QE97_TRIMR
MSLFQTRELWRSKIELDDNVPQLLCLTVATLLENSDALLIGTADGTVYAFEPSVSVGKGGQPTGDDLVLQKRLLQPVLQLLAGRFKSNSTDYQLAILHPRSVAVYAAIALDNDPAKEPKEMDLELLYERVLTHSAHSFIGGPLGSEEHEADFICVQSLDGVIYLLEQEVNIYSHYLPSFLLPGPMCYSKTMGIFVTFNSAWQVQSFKYDRLLLNASRKEDADKDRKEERHYLSPEWSVLIGERAIEIGAVDVPQSSVALVVLGERNLFLFNTKGLLSATKQLNYVPHCLHLYGTNATGASRFLIATEDGAMLLYNNTTLRWAAKLPFPPVNLCLARIGTLKGIIVALSSSGELLCAYLGTEPYLDQAMIKRPNEQSYAKRLGTMKELAFEMKHLKSRAEIAMEHPPQDDLSIRCIIAEALDQDYDDENSCDKETAPIFKIQTILTKKGNAADVMLTFRSSTFVRIIPQVISLAAIEDKVVQNFCVHQMQGRIPAERNLILDATYLDSNGKRRALVSKVNLPLEKFYAKCPGKKTAIHKVTLEINKPLVSLDRLFPELGITIDELEKWDNCIGLRLLHGKVPPAIILAPKTAARYRVQGGSLGTLWVPIAEIVRRLREVHYPKEQLKVAIVGGIPLDEYFKQLDAFFQLSDQRAEVQRQLDGTAVEFRILQRQFFSSIKDSDSNLHTFQGILQDTCKQLTSLADSANRISESLGDAANALKASNQLIADLFTLSPSLPGDSRTLLRAALAFDENDVSGQQWITQAAKLMEMASKGLFNGKPIAQAAVVQSDDNAQRFKKLLSALMERVTAKN